MENAVKQIEIVLDGDELALRDVTEVGALIEVDRRRKFRQKMIGDVVIDVETREIASFLPFDLVDQEMRKYEAAFRMLGVRQRIESLGWHLTPEDLDAHVHHRASMARDPLGGVSKAVEKRP